VILINLVLRLPLGIGYPFFGATVEEGYGNLLLEEELIERWVMVQREQAVALTRNCWTVALTWMRY